MGCVEGLRALRGLGHQGIVGIAVGFVKNGVLVALGELLLGGAGFAEALELVLGIPIAARHPLFDAEFHGHF